MLRSRRRHHFAPSLSREVSATDDPNLRKTAKRRLRCAVWGRTHQSNVRCCHVAHARSASEASDSRVVAGCFLMLPTSDGFQKSRQNVRRLAAHVLAWIQRITVVSPLISVEAGDGQNAPNVFVQPSI
ncbi:hypothetical protein CCHR01_09246 [Colletotrichum chrysophilum]|uniref:Uncharacterized protein n=1 Tax=Colletotrichum chrysophilum TaxID=1836956 RepID=A0AAD9EEC6_9PEZI|nr:hypothetical protein CCHR01_09246 [Colletotrichum chrysophilum]